MQLLIHAGITVKPVIRKICPCHDNFCGLTITSGVFYIPQKLFNTIKPRQNGRHFENYLFRLISLQFLYFDLNCTKICFQGFVNSKPALVQIMAWRLTGDKLLSEPMVAKFVSCFPTGSFFLQGRGDIQLMPSILLKDEKFRTSTQIIFS